jgi:ribosomal protein S18 acetylase RimI-like enzyme
MQIGDLAAVFALGEELFTADRWPTLYRTWDEYELAVHFASDSEMCWVAEVDGKLAGFAVGTLLEKRGSAWTYGHLLWLGVNPAAGRKGIGGLLTTKMQQVFIGLGARMILVDTDADNKPAIAFFQRAGFEHDSAHVYLSKNLTYDPGYLAHHRKGRVAGRSASAQRTRRRSPLRPIARHHDSPAPDPTRSPDDTDRGEASG